MRQILVIDDDAVLRRRVRRALKFAGYEVFEADGGYDGVQRFRDHPTELVLIDLLMPGQDGIETARQIKLFRPIARILGMTDHNMADAFEFDRTSGNFGADAWLTKPFLLGDLLDAVALLLVA